MRDELHHQILDIGDHAKMSALIQLTPTFNATYTDSPQPPLEELLTIFFSQYRVARVEISSRDVEYLWTGLLLVE